MVMADRADGSYSSRIWSDENTHSNTKPATSALRNILPSSTPMRARNDKVFHIRIIKADNWAPFL